MRGKVVEGVTEGSKHIPNNMILNNFTAFTN